MSRADIVIASSSTEYVNVPVQAFKNGTPYNPTTDVVSMAFVAGSAQPTSFFSAIWQTTVQGGYIAQCLIGPANSGNVLAPGIYTIWVKITDNPEVPVRPAGTIQVT